MSLAWVPVLTLVSLVVNAGAVVPTDKAIGVLLRNLTQLFYYLVKTAGRGGERDAGRGLIAGYIPEVGGSFEVIGFSDRSGDFTNPILPDLSGGLAFQTQFTSNRLLLTVQ